MKIDFGSSNRIEKTLKCQRQLDGVMDGKAATKEEDYGIKFIRTRLVLIYENIHK